MDSIWYFILFFSLKFQVWIRLNQLWLIINVTNWQFWACAVSPYCTYAFTNYVKLNCGNANPNWKIFSTKRPKTVFWWAPGGPRPPAPRVRKKVGTAKVRGTPVPGNCLLPRRPVPVPAEVRYRNEIWAYPISWCTSSTITAIIWLSVMNFGRWLISLPQRDNVKVILRICICFSKSGVFGPFYLFGCFGHFWHISAPLK